MQAQKKNRGTFFFMASIACVALIEAARHGRAGDVAALLAGPT